MTEYSDTICLDDWEVWESVDQELPKESGEYHVFYKLPDHDCLLHCLIEWDNDKQAWDAPDSENIWWWRINS